MLKKVGRFVATRLQGSKGKHKYDDWMRRNPLVGSALDVAGYGGMALAAPHLLAKTPLKGLLVGQKVAGSGNAVAGMSDAALGQVANAGASMPAAALADVPSGMQAAGGLVRRGGRAVYDFAKANPLASAMTLEGLLSGAQNAQQMRLERQRIRMEEERRNNLAQLLMPMFAQYHRGQ
jgi:hypothetical protein